MDTIQAGLGDALLLLASLGVVLIGSIVVLVEIDGRAGHTSQEDGGR